MAKRITVTLSNKAEQYFNKLMYSLPSRKSNDGTGMCTMSDAINESLESLADFEKITDDQLVNWLVTNHSDRYAEINSSDNLHYSSESSRLAGEFPEAI